MDGWMDVGVVIVVVGNAPNPTGGMMDILVCDKDTPALKMQKCRFILH